MMISRIIKLFASGVRIGVVDCFPHEVICDDHMVIIW